MSSTLSKHIFFYWTRPTVGERKMHPLRRRSFRMDRQLKSNYILKFSPFSFCESNKKKNDLKEMLMGRPSECNLFHLNDWEWNKRRWRQRMGFAWAEVKFEKCQEFLTIMLERWSAPLRVACSCKCEKLSEKNETDDLAFSGSVKAHAKIETLVVIWYKKRGEHKKAILYSQQKPASWKWTTIEVHLKIEAQAKKKHNKKRRETIGNKNQHR